MVKAPKTGLLLINLGTPNSPAPSDVRPYLREFLMDPRVIDLPGWKRWLFVNLILIRRPKASGEAYGKIWTDEGSPLLVNSRALTAKVADRLPGIHVELGMRYGQPSVASALKRMRDTGVNRFAVFPLYPQYSSAANGSSLEKVSLEASKFWDLSDIETIPPFYDDAGFIEANGQRALPVIEATDPERVFFSFHGLPERHVIKGDESGKHCLQSEDCCATIGDANRHCYRAQCYATARALAEWLGLVEDDYIVCFQSRLGRDPWIKPYTDVIVNEAAENGLRRAVILSPGFVADCLETLEELGIRAVEDFKKRGGERLEVVPCVNADDTWADALVAIVRRHSRAIGGPPPSTTGATT